MRRRQIEIHGHRGARGLWPENSLAGFKNTIELGVDVIEMDVVLCGDGQVLISHDPYFNPDICLDPNGNEILDKAAHNFFRMSYEEISKYDCGSKRTERFPNQMQMSVTKPLLSDTLEELLLKSPKMRFNIEIKSYDAWRGIYQPKSISEYVEAVIQVVKSLPYDQYNLQSFDVEVLIYIAKKYPDIRLAYLIEDQKLSQNSAKEMGIAIYAISPYFKLLDKDLVRIYQEQGLKVIPWTVNEVDDMNLMISWGVDGIISDYPDRLISLLTP